MTSHLAITVALVGLGVFGIIDVIWRKLPDALTAAFLAVVLALSLPSATPVQLVHGLLAALVVGLIYLELGTFGIFGGGDVKLSVTPAFALGVVNPILAVWWLSISLSIQGVFSLINRGTHRGRPAAPLALPHVPAMLAAFLIAYSVAGFVR